MLTVQIAHVSRESLRGVWHTDMGQAVEQWVPPGVYTVARATFRSQAAMRLSCGDRTYLVGPAALYRDHVWNERARIYPEGGTVFAEFVEVVGWVISEEPSPELESVARAAADSYHTVPCLA